MTLMTIQQLYDLVLEGVELTEEERGLFLSTFSLKYLQELIGFLSVTGVLDAADITQIATLLNTKISAVSEEKRAELNLDETLAKMQITTLGMVVSTLTDSFSEADKSKIQQNAQRLAEQTNEVASTI